MVALFTGALIMVVYFVVYLSFTEQDTILDTHEFYYYSKMVENWGSPPDTAMMSKEIRNLKMIGGVFKDGERVWSHPVDFSYENYLWYSDSEYLGEIYDIDIPLFVTFGEIDLLPAASVSNGDYEYYFAVEFIPPSEFILRIVPASILTVLFMIILFIFIKQYLSPINKIKRRILALEMGDLDATINISGHDELADLSGHINKLILDIKSLLTKKQELLSDVSHELRSPLARMQLLIEMMPEHKNLYKLKQEVYFLERIISNLLLSDKLSIPYRTLDINKIFLPDFIDRIIARVTNSSTVLKLMLDTPPISVHVDDTKMRIAFLNLIDNALKYGGTEKPVEVACSVGKLFFYYSVKDYGPGISPADVARLTDPFFKASTNKRKDGFGLGLSITRKIIEAHGGKLLIDSKLDIGSEFTIKIPLVRILKSAK
jgi:signal transduction histidine kinase